jgi:hypothetical protein
MQSVPITTDVVFESLSGRGIQLYVIKFVNDLRQVAGFLRILWCFHHDITEILLKVALKHHKHVTHKPIVDSLKELTDPSYTVQVCFIVISTSNIFICLLMGKESLDI